MNNKLFIKLGVLCSLLLLFAFIPKNDDPIDKLIVALQKWTDTMPQEKVYLHVDKPYYAIGDTIWFKGYVTIGSRHQLSKLSGALYVDLINEKDSIVKDLKLPITSGMVVGDFILGDDYKQGSYRIRAYTQWMRNAGEDYFYDHTFTVGDLISHNIITKADYQYKEINGKQVLTASINYSDDKGKPITGKDVDYQIMIDKKRAWVSSERTDAQGNILVRIANDAHVDLSGAYIHTFIAGDDKYPIIRDFPIKAVLSQSDVQFFPESGSLVNGISSRVAFKAIGVDGLGIPIKGTIVDELNGEVAVFESLHAGMGSFSLKPQSGKTYRAKISFADGTIKTEALPKPIEDGYVLSVFQPNRDSILVRVNASAKQVTTSENLSFIAQTSGEVIFASSVKINRPITSIWLEKKKFPTGIAQFTIFNNNGEPLNERVAFVRTNDQMQIVVKTAKNSYKNKEQVHIELETKDSQGNPTTGNFSVAVIDDSKVPFDEASESTIFTSLLLTSDLTGYIEKPNYYFINESGEVNKALDNLMLTQGYRRFTWGELSNPSNIKPVFEAEGLGTNISGKVTTLTGKPLTNATVNLISVRAKLAKSTTTDANGHFKFDGIFLLDSIKFSLQARTNKGSDKVKLIIDSIPKVLINKNKNRALVSTNITQELKSYIEAINKQDDINEKLGRLDQVHRLREVRIRARKTKEQVYSVQGGYKLPEGLADQTLIIKDADNYATLGTYLAGVLRGITFKSYKPTDPNHPSEIFPEVQMYPFSGSAPLTIIEDGRKLSPEEAAGVFDNTELTITDIIKVELVKFASQAMGLTGPALFIQTNRGMTRKFYNPSVANIVPKGFNKVREFYLPRYDKVGPDYKVSDMRTTIYWNPSLKTDTTGKTTFDFFGTDNSGPYKIIVEGIYATGELGRHVYLFNN